MGDDLGARLLRAGLVTREQLAEALATAPEHGGALVVTLAGRAVPEDALAGFFVAEGFGPLMDADDLASADPAAIRRLPGAMAADLLALPVRASPAGLVVAMAAPSDRHAVREIARAVGGEVLPTVACVGPLRAAIGAAHPGTTPRAAPALAPESEAPVLELVRRRGTPAEGVWAGTSDPGAGGSGKLGPGPRLAVAEDEVAVPLVRTKPMTTPAAGIPVAVAAAALPVKTGPRVITKSFARPDPARKPSAPAMLAARPVARGAGRSERGTAEYPAPPEEQPGTGAATGGAGAGGAGAGAGAEGTGRAGAEGTVRAGTEGTGRAGDAAAAPLPSSRAASIVPPEHERWDVATSASHDRAPADAPPAKLPAARASAELPRAKTPPPEIGTTLAAIRAATDRDEVVRLACDAAITVSRAAVFLALRKGVLKGWEAAGGGPSRDAVRNLWIPTSSASTFKDVVDRREPYVGPYGTSVADGLFRAAVGSRGGIVAIHPIEVGDKIVGVLAIDDLLAHGSLPKHRIEILAHAVSEAFKRILSAKRG